MAFTQRCVAAPKPHIYLIQRFVGGDGSLTDYPPETRRSFQYNFMRNINLFVRRANTDNPGKQEPTLFDVADVRDFNSTPRFLRSGDIILGFVHFPPYEINYDRAMKVYTDLKGPKRRPSTARGFSTLIDTQLSAMADRYWDNICERWRERVSEQYQLPPISKGQPAEPDDGLSVYSVTPATVRLRTGSKAKIYYAYRIGLIDVAFPAAVAVREWGSPADESEKLVFLQKHNFGPEGVAALGRDKVKRRAYLDRVGRGLAYNLLHEFWHCATGISEHPIESSNKNIESDTGANSKFKDLVFQNKIIKDILNKYENTWCKYINEGRVGIGELM